MNRIQRLIIVVVLQIVLVQLAIAESLVISPNEMVEKNFLIYQVGSDEPFTGRVMSTRYDGSKAYEELYVDGRLHGARVEWDRVGNKISETTYNDGAKTGPESHWYLSGQVMAVTHYLNGARHGLATRWCDNGQKRHEWSYVNNMKDGMQSTWYVTGQKSSEATFSNDRPSGNRTIWYEDGQVKMSVNVDRDRKIFTAENWYEGGQKKCEEIRAKGAPPARTAWDKDGNELELEEEKFFAHCNSSMGPFILKPGERMVSMRGDTNTMTRYGTTGTETTETEVKVSAAQRADMIARQNSAIECGLPGEMGH
jgi:antitoxin component YwqK of YwqJK toxin-antitoxin module